MMFARLSLHENMGRAHCRRIAESGNFITAATYDEAGSRRAIRRQKRSC